MLTPTDAAAIRAAAKLVVYDNLLQWNVGVYDHLLNGSCLGTGIQELTLKNLFGISPNPASDFLTVTYLSQDYTMDIQLELYNTTGQLLQEIKIPNHGELNIGHLLPGMYFLKAKNVPSEMVKFIKL